jgi:hypothetical protein
MSVTDKMLDAAQGAYDTFSMTGVCDRNATRKAIEAAMQAAWVSVSDRLPEPMYIDGTEFCKEYLVYDTLNKKVSHDYFHSAHGWNHYGGHVTYWMPLPEHKGEL